MSNFVSRKFEIMAEEGLTEEEFDREVQLSEEIMAEILEEEK